MNFEADFFDSLIEQTLFYSPKIEIKPAHLANGLFRAVTGVVADDVEQHEAIHPRKNEQLEEIPRNVREMLPALLGADRTLYGTPRFSSYTLSHATHITSDNHDRRTGEWLRAILETGEETTALSLMRTLLMEEDSQRSDELSVLTLPKSPHLDNLKSAPRRLPNKTWPSSLCLDQDGEFVDPLLRSIRQGFNQLAKHDQEMARWGGKLDTLRRMAMWGCFSVYLHLANVGRDESETRVPILFCMGATDEPTLKQASIQSYQWVSRSLDRFFRRAIEQQIVDWHADGRYGAWDKNEENRARVQEMTWKRIDHGGMRAQKTNEDYARDFLRFYNSYQSAAAGMPPMQAFAHAATDMLDLFLSSSPADIARALGVQIGLLSAPRKRTEKLYAPEADLLEVLVRASLPVGELWTLPDLAHYWVDQYGVLFGALGDENERLATWGIESVAGDEYQLNVNRLVDLLEMSGYARRYADGVVLVQVPRLE